MSAIIGLTKRSDRRHMLNINKGSRMTYREKLITEVWKAETHAIDVKILKLDDRRQDSGLTEEEILEYNVLMHEHARLLGDMLKAMSHVRSA